MLTVVVFIAMITNVGRKQEIIDDLEESAITANTAQEANFVCIGCSAEALKAGWRIT
jgi:hypothetical protein